MSTYRGKIFEYECRVHELGTKGKYCTVPINYRRFLGAWIRNRFGGCVTASMHAEMSFLVPFSCHCFPIVIHTQQMLKEHPTQWYVMLLPHRLPRLMIVHSFFAACLVFLFVHENEEEADILSTQYGRAVLESNTCS